MIFNHASVMQGNCNSTLHTDSHSLYWGLSMRLDKVQLAPLQTIKESLYCGLDLDQHLPKKYIDKPPKYSLLNRLSVTRKVIQTSHVLNSLDNRPNSTIGGSSARLVFYYTIL